MAQARSSTVVVTAVWAIAAGILGLKGIQYVAKVATFLPLIPLVILVVLFIGTAGGLDKFNPTTAVAAGEKVTVEVAGIEGKCAEIIHAKPALPAWGVIAMLCTYVVGFFATAGAAGCDFGMNNRDARDVQLGGLVGVAGSTIFAGGLSLLIVAGAMDSRRRTIPPS